MPKAAAVRAAEPVATPSCLHEIGETAGQVWQALHKQGSLSVAKLVEHVGGNRDVVMQAVGWLAREGEGTRSVTRTLYDQTLRVRQDMRAEGYRLEAGFGWWLFQPSGGKSAVLGVGARLAPYFQTLDEPSPPGTALLFSPRRSCVKDV